MVSLYYTGLLSVLDWLHWGPVATGCNCYGGPTWTGLEWSQSSCLKFGKWKDQLRSGCPKIGVKDRTGLDFKTLSSSVEVMDLMKSGGEPGWSAFGVTFSIFDSLTLRVWTRLCSSADLWCLTSWCSIHFSLVWRGWVCGSLANRRADL